MMIGDKKILFRNQRAWHSAPRHDPLSAGEPNKKRREQAERDNTRKEPKERMKTDSRENDLWTRIMEDMRQTGDVGSYGMESYLSKLELQQDTGTKLILTYPEDLPIMWVELNYLDYIINSATRVLQGARSVEFVQQDAAGEQAEAEEAVQQNGEALLPLEFSAEEEVQPEQAGESKAPVRPTAKRKRVRSVSPFNSGLNEDYGFESFIVGENSEFAYAAAKAIVENPGRLYNPLFIHGDPGLGKTHLLQAIGNAIRAQDEDTHVLYVTSEDFTNDYIDAIERKGEALRNFRRKYRKASVLLIDDIQFLTKKGKTQDEFFHTFNALFASGKQIVLTADCPAADVIGMDSRLTSRFEQGLSVALMPPSYETRMAILRSKRRQWRGEFISDELLDFLAKNITRSVRRLEGALTRLSTFASFSHHRPSVSEARMQLKDFLRDEPVARLSIKEIQQCVADEFNLRVADLNGRRRTVNIAHPRQIAMFLARHHSGCSLQDIGAAFGGREHGTVIHAMRTIEQKLLEDEELRSTLNRMMATLGV